MASRMLSAVVAVIGIGVAVLLFFVLRDDDESGAPATPATTTTEARDEQREAQPEPKPEVATIVVRDGQPVGGVQELEVSRGERIRFVVESDVAEEVHLHGYDIAKEVEAGGSVEFDVPARIEGVFEVELEHSAVQLAEISVAPA
jgi:hypothetical protein